MANSNLTAAIVFISIPTVAYGGYFLLSIIKRSKMGVIFANAPFAQRMFRAGHAHAGVWLVLSLAAIPFIDIANISEGSRSVLLYSFPLSALLVSAGFFASAFPLDSKQTKPGRGIVLVYAGAISLTLSCFYLSWGLFLV